MSRYSFKLPDIGEGIAEAEIAEWHVALGDVVEEDQTLVDVLTDKAAVDISSPVSGKVVELCGAAGDKVAVGGVLIVFETDAHAGANADAKPDAAAEPGGGAAPAAKESAPAESANAESPNAKLVSQEAASAAQDGTPPGAAQAASGDKVLASPAVRRRAREAGLDLGQVAGTGPMGRVRQADLDAALKLGGSTPAVPVGSTPAAQAPRAPVTPPPQARSQKIIGLRRKIAEAMTASYQRIPHFSYVEEIDVTELLRLRERLNAERREGQPKLSLLPFLGLALCRVLPDYPQANAVFDDANETLHESAGVHLGIATQTEQALMVPVVADAQQRDLWGLAQGIDEVVAAARSGRAKREQLSGSTITITSLGKLGGLVSTPIINAPEVAIIGVNKIREQLSLEGGQLQARQVMNLSSSFDHRIVDGHQAASLVQALKRRLEHPALLFMP